MREFNKAFQIDKGFRQSGRLTPLHFNFVLEKFVREWKKASTPTHQLGLKLREVEFDCLAKHTELI